jgi:hypothetical protein
MPRAKTTAAPSVLPARIDPQAEKQEALKLAQPLVDAVQVLSVTTEEEYQEADGILARVRSARKVWGDRLEKIIRPIRTGLDELYTLNREGDRPFQVLEDSIKAKMKDFKVAELRRIQAAAAEEDRLKREAEEKARAAEAAKTPQMRGRLESQAAQLEQKAAAVAWSAPTPVAAVSSVTRQTKGWRIKDEDAFYKGLAEGYIPRDVMDIKVGTMNRHLRDDPEGMEAWPGVEVFDDVQIVGR